MKLMNVFGVVGLALSLTACFKDEPNADTVVKLNMVKQENELDKFIAEKFTKPYNLDLNYRFLERNHSKNYYLQPVTYEKAVLFSNLLDYLYFQPYKRVLPEKILKEYSIKSLLLAGLPSYSNGVITNALTTNASTIAIYGINNVDIKQTEVILKKYMHTVYHESAHLLHQTIDYTPVYKELSTLDYKEGDAFRYWSRTGESYLKAGFITEYASTNADEDFVEVISTYITHTDAQWEAKLKEADGKNNSEAKLTGRQILERKLQLAKDYLLTNWSFDLDKVRAEVQKQYNTLSTQDLTKLNFN